MSRMVDPARNPEGLPRRKKKAIVRRSALIALRAAEEQTMSSTTVRAPYTFGEELANSLIHGFGVVLSIAGLIALLSATAITGGVREIASCAIYGATLVLLYTT